MKVIEKGVGRGIDTTGKRACETPIHSLRGPLATLLPTPDYIIFILRCDTCFIGVSCNQVFLNVDYSIRNSYLKGSGASVVVTFSATL